MLTTKRIGFLSIACAVALAGCATAPPERVANASPQGRCAPTYQWNADANRGEILWNCENATPSGQVTVEDLARN